MDAITIRAGLDHPIVDSDGHLAETIPIFLEYLERVAGPDLVRRYRESAGWGGHTNMRSWGDLSDPERRGERISIASWWASPVDARDRATSFVMKLFYQRLDEFGIDFAIVYPSLGGMLPGFLDEEMRRAGCRAMNTYLRDATAEFSDRMTVPAIIPMVTPEEAIDELEHSVRVLGSKCAVLQRYVRRPVAAHPEASAALGLRGHWIDVLGLDSEHDYDPVWAKCIELGVAATTHTGCMGTDFRDSISNYVYNHIGQFATAGEASAKALFLGGVTARFPELRFAFLEGGVDWGVRLLVNLTEHWEKRGGQAIRALDPARLDRDQLAELLDEYADAPFARQDVRHYISEHLRSHPDELDDYARARIEDKQDICERYVPHFFFGCEADDPLAATAFDTRLNPFGARLHAMLGSDIGHWDVPEMNQVLVEAHRLVERDLLTPDDFRDFAFANAVRLHAGTNPGFFDGTVVADAAREVLRADEEAG